MKRMEFPNCESIFKYYKNNKKILKRSVSKDFKLWCFAYTDHCNFNGPWNNITLHCRGVIFTNKGELVYWPFNKFFNYGSHLAPTVKPGDMYWFTRKYDGVLIKAFLYEGKTIIASRTSFDNEYTEKAGIVAKKYNDLKHLDYADYWHMFELISPEYSMNGFLVTEYDKDDLVLIGLRRRCDGLMVNPEGVQEYARDKGLRVTEVFYDSIEGVMAKKEQRTGSTEEGWVLFTDKGEMAKIKRDDYMDYLHMNKFSNSNSFAKICTKMIDREFDEWYMNLTGDKKEVVTPIVSEILSRKEILTNRIAQILVKIPVFSERREFYAYVSKNWPKYAGTICALKDGNNSKFERCVLTLLKNRVV